MEKIQECLAEQFVVGADRGQRGIELGDDADASGLPLGLDERGHAGEQRIQVDGLERDVLGPHEAQESLDDPIEPADLAAHHLGVFSTSSGAPSKRSFNSSTWIIIALSGFFTSWATPEVSRPRAASLAE